MANVLLVDSDVVAHVAMQGIVSRGGNRFATVTSVAEAWNFIRRNVKIDIVFLELKLKEASGLTLIQDLRADCILRSLPLVVYTGHPDRDSVRKVLELKVQNFLVKPFREDIVLAEISKSNSEPWIPRTFETAESGWDPERLKAILEKLSKTLVDGHVTLAKRKLKQGQSSKPIVDWLKRLSMFADKAGAETVVNCLDELVTAAADGRWPDGDENNDPLSLASRLISAYLDSESVPDDFKTEEELNSEELAQERKVWSDAIVDDRCPVIGFQQVKREIDKLTSCPIAESISASFQMAATGHPTSLAPLLEIVYRDPGLTAQILIEANRLKKDKEATNRFDIEETRMAIGLLGENRLASLGSAFETIPDRQFDSGNKMSWSAFRTFQLNTGKMAEFICEYLEMPMLGPVAYTAGLMHDLGKTLLTRLHPFALPEIQAYALQSGIKQSAAEKHFIQCTTQEAAVYFAEKQSLPKRFISVFRWIDDASSATRDAELVAIVSLARDFCRINKIGFNGDVATSEKTPLADTSAWKVLNKRVYLNFDLKKFEQAASEHCQNLT